MSESGLTFDGLKLALAQAQRDLAKVNICSCCAGDPICSDDCICGGPGTLFAEAQGLRELCIELRADLATVRAELGATQLDLREKRRHLESASKGNTKHGNKMAKLRAELTAMRLENAALRAESDQLRRERETAPTCSFRNVGYCVGGKLFMVEVLTDIEFAEGDEVILLRVPEPRPDEVRS